MSARPAGAARRRESSGRRRPWLRLGWPGYATLILIFGGAAGGSGRTDPQVVALASAVLLSLLLIGLVVPLVAVRRTRVAASAPVDAVVGTATPVRVVLTGRAARASVRLLDPAGPYFATSVPGEGPIDHTPQVRGVFPVVRVEVRSSWPLGLVTVGRVHEVALLNAVHVAPRPTQVRVNPPSLPDEVSDSMRMPSAAADGDVVRSVRPYRPGDAPRTVHWPSSARAGTLVVRELDPPVRTGFALVVDLSHAPLPVDVDAEAHDPAAKVERTASLAAGVVAAALQAGAVVLLCTHELDGPVVAPVRTPREAGRRLARAMAGAAPEPPHGWPAVRLGP